MDNKIYFEAKLWKKVFRLLLDNEPSISYEGLLYHYTTPTGLLGILQNQNIWATEASFLNDLYEIRYGHDITKEILKSYVKDSSAFTQNFSKLTLSYFHSINSKEEEIYIASFCETSDLLSQWKGYTNFGEGYAIGLNLKKLIKTKNSEEFNHVSIKKVIYDKKMQYSMVKSKIKFMINQSKALCREDTINRDNIIKACAKSLAYHLNEQSKRFKSNAFSEEKEWRAIYVNSTLSKENRINNNFRMFDSIITPYIKLNLCKTDKMQCSFLPINTIIVGPKINFKKAAKSINFAYKNIGRKAPKIKESKISLQ